MELTRTIKEYIVAQDVAKRRDYMTTHIYRRTPEVTYYPEETGRPPQVLNHLDLLYIEKSQGVNYIDQGRHTLELLQALNFVNNFDLLIDGTGVGEAVVDIYRELGMNPLPIVFISGDSPQAVYEDFGKVFSRNKGGKFRGSQVLKEIRVPKKDLVHAGSIVMQQRRLRIAPGLEYVQDFRYQLENFTGKVNEKTGNIKYENASDEIHDDHVVTYLMAAWWLTYSRVTEKDQVAGNRSSTYKSFDPFDFVDKI